MPTLNRFLLTMCLVFACSAAAFAQTYTIKGKVSDTANDNALHYASITIMKAADSTLETFTRTHEDGTFTAQVSEKGKYIIMSVFPGFADYVDKIDVQDATTDVGLVPMISRTNLMKEVIITDQFAAIKIKGDTVEYVADSFMTKEGANVEELLKKLPGLQVDKDGKIMAHGQEVKKLLVDGEEFFTDDPAVVSKSLAAKAVDKVQVFDKKSDQAEFTGIDDGDLTRTVNLQLKDNMKKGYFGKVTAGGGAGDDRTYFENQAMLNAFKGKRKISAFGIMANTGKVGLGWEDRDKFGGGGDGNTIVEDDGSMITYYSGGDEFDSWDGRYNGQGYPKAWTGGLHYSDKWNEDKHHIGANYRYAKQNIESMNNNITQNILADSQYFSKQREDNFKTGQRHKVDGLYEWKTDSLSTLKLSVMGNYSNSQNRSVSNSQTLAGDGEIINNSDKVKTDDATTQRLNASLTWRKKFNKKRRTLMASLTENYEESDSKGFLYALNTFRINGTNISTPVDQRKENDNEKLLLSGSISYTEPITKVMSVSIDYRANINNSTAKRNTFNKSNADAYDALDSTFSNNYEYNIITNTGGTNLSWNMEKFDISAGGSASNTNFMQRDLMRDTTFDYSVLNFFPKASIRYKINKQSSLRLNYSGSTRQPTIQQIQPIQDNTNPLNIMTGNADLTQEFRHTFSINGNDYKVLSGRWMYVWGSYNIIDNAITRSETVSGTGIRTTQYINMDGNYNGNLGGGIGKRIAKLNSRIGGNLSANLSRTNNIVNGIKNTSNFNSYSIGVDGGYDAKDEKLEVSFGVDYTYNDNKTTIAPATSYWTVDNNFNISYNLPWKLEVGTDFNWYVRQRTAVFDRNNNVFRWNAFVSKKFLKNDQLELQATVYDILNQNQGFNRYAQSNQVTENTYNTIKRYAMLSLIWNFTKTAAGATPENDAASFITK